MMIAALKYKVSVIIVVCVVACAALLVPQQAHAGYLDPGSGSTAVQWVIAGVAAMGRLKRRVSDMFSKVLGR